MKKRSNPLDETKNTSHTLSKRVNPLEINASAATPVLEKKEVQPVLTVDQISQMNRKFVFTRVSKVLVETYKQLYPSTKFGILIENALLHYLHDTNKERYDTVVSKLNPKGDIK